MTYPLTLPLPCAIPRLGHRPGPKGSRIFIFISEVMAELRLVEESDYIVSVDKKALV